VPGQQTLDLAHGPLLARNPKAPPPPTPVQELVVVAPLPPLGRPHQEFLRVNQHHRLPLPGDVPAPPPCRWPAPKLLIDLRQLLRLPPVVLAWLWALPGVPQQPVDS